MFKPFLFSSLKIIAIASLAACQTIDAPQFVETRIDVLKTHYAQPNMGAVQHLQWQEYFQTPTLQHLIAQALSGGTDMQMAILQVAEAQALYGIQKADTLPSITGSAEGARSRSAQDLRMGLPAISEQISVGLGFQSWELDLWGRIAHLNAASKQQFLASQANQLAVRNSMIAQVANQYLILCELNERIVLAQQSRAAFQESVRIFKRRYEVGSGAKTEYVQAQTLLSQAEHLLQQLQQAQQKQQHLLSVLVGQPVPPIHDVVSVIQWQNQSQHVGMPSDWLLNRPDIVAAEHRLQAAHAQIGAARAAFFPRIALTANVGTASHELNGLFQSGNGVWSVVPNITMPIFNAGRLKANVNLAQIRQEMAVVQYEHTIHQAFREVADALSDDQWLQRQIITQNTAVQAGSERVRLAKLNYEYGMATYLEVLDAERELLNLQQNRVQIQRQLLQAQVALYVAVGGDAALTSLKPSIN